MAKFTRRSLLRGTGAGLALSPFLSLLEGQQAQSAPGRVKRVLLFCTMGTQPDVWKPTAVSGENITAFSDSTAPLAGIRENIVMVEGCPSGSPGEGHGSPQSLTGLGYQYSGTATSLDQFIAAKLPSMGIDRPIKSLLLGDGTNDPVNPEGKVQFMRNGTILYPQASPRTAFNTVFGNFVPPTGGGGVDALKNRRLRTYDMIQAEIGELQGRLGTNERARLELHRQSIQQIQARLMQPTQMPMGSCMVPTIPADSTNVLTNNRTHLDIIVNAFACDITRVAAIHYGNDQFLKVDLPSIMLSGNQHNDFIHSGMGESWARLIKFEAWLAGEFAYVVDQLKTRDEADGSGKLLDNTIVAWCRDLGDAHVHNQESMRFVLAGGANKYLKTSPMGRYIKRPGITSPGGQAPMADRHERVLLNICEAIGITDYTGFGAPTANAGGVLEAAYKKPMDGIAVA